MTVIIIIIIIIYNNARLSGHLVTSLNTKLSPTNPAFKQSYEVKLIQSLSVVSINNLYEGPKLKQPRAKEPDTSDQFPCLAIGAHA